MWQASCLDHHLTRGSQWIKIDIWKSYDKSISIDKSANRSKSILTRRRSVNFIDFIGFIDRYWIDKNYPVSVERPGAFDCDSLNADFKGGNEMICGRALYKRPKRLLCDFLPDFIVRLPGFDYKRKFSWNENLQRKQNWAAKFTNREENAGKIKSVFDFLMRHKHKHKQKKEPTYLSHAVLTCA